MHVFSTNRQLMVRQIATILFVLGAFLLALFAILRISSYWHSYNALRAFAQHNARNSANRNPDDGVSFALWAPGRIKAYESSLANDTDIPIAVLQINKVHLRVPVFEGTSDLALDRGAGWIEGTARPGDYGNVAIAAHRDGFFRALKDVSIGDTVQLQTVAETDSFIVNQIEIVSPSDVRVLQSSAGGRITLVTCYPFYYLGSAPERYIVEGTETVRSFAPTENAQLNPMRTR